MTQILEIIGSAILAIVVVALFDDLENDCSLGRLAKLVPWALAGLALLVGSMLAYEEGRASVEIPVAPDPVVVVKESKIHAEYIGDFDLTAYCCEKYEHVCGTGSGITASGQPVQAGVTVAADTDVFPFGTVLYIEGVGIRVVQDIGGAVEGNHLDVAVPLHEDAIEFGRKTGKGVYVLEVNDNE